MATPIEDDLLARCFRRDPSAWEEFLARYRDLLERAARATLQRVLGSVRQDDLESIVETTLLGIVKDDFATLRAFAGRSSLEGYLRAVTSKIALHHLRSERRKGWLRFRSLESVADAPAADPAIPEDPQRLAILRSAMDQLPPRDRLILKLFYLDGASYKEIAALLGLAMNAVSPALIRARQKIRALLEETR